MYPPGIAYLPNSPNWLQMVPYTVKPLLSKPSRGRPYWFERPDFNARTVSNSLYPYMSVQLPSATSVHRFDVRRPQNGLYSAAIVVVDTASQAQYVTLIAIGRLVLGRSAQQPIAGRLANLTRVIGSICPASPVMMKANAAILVDCWLKFVNKQKI